MKAEVRWRGDVIERRLRKALKRGVHAAGIILQNTTKELLKTFRTTRGQRSESTAGEPPGRMSGELRSSIKVLAEEEDGDTFRVKVGTNKRYAKVQEFGHPRIVATTAEALVIPVGRRGAQLAEEAGKGGLRTLNLTYIPLRPRRGNIVARLVEIKAVQKTGRRRIKGTIGLTTAAKWELRSQTVFLLATHISLPARPYLRPAREDCKEEVRAVIGEAVAKALGG